jgi:dTDP-4-amino-4,6-dideoxygalactose transaminase
MVDHRDSVQKKLTDVGVPSSIYYFKALHQHRAFMSHAPKGGLASAERLAERVLSLPMHPYLTDEQIDRVAAAVKSAI